MTLFDTFEDIVLALSYCDAVVRASAVERHELALKADALDTKRAVEMYTRFYPLFQQAYVDLGFPNGHFNDRFVEVIDHLLATPEVKGPVQLVVPHVLPEYADPTLQERSTGQKLLIRMGPENAARVKAKLRELRGELTRQ